MANYLCIFAAPDSHIEFIKRNPESLYAYLEGSPPVASAEPPKRPVCGNGSSARRLLLPTLSSRAVGRPSNQR
jgi:hypothetical protein